MVSVTNTELELLKLLWVLHPQTARELTESLYGEATASNLATVQKLLQRLEAKQCVERNRNTHPHLFSAAISQAELAGMRFDELADKVAGGSYLPFITHLVHSNRLSDEERKAIRRLLEDGGGQ